jgi:CRISPR-associated protein Csx14
MDPAVCIATVGGQPQLITYFLDSLLEKKEKITKLILLRLTPRSERLLHAHLRLKSALDGSRYRGIAVEWFTLEVDGLPIKDIRSTAEADVVSNLIHTQIHQLKRQGHRLHVGVTGGRRMLGLVTMSTAMLNFDRHDRLWHMHTPDEFRPRARDEQIMHIPPGVPFSLIEVPILPLGHYFAPLQGFGGVSQQRFILNHQELDRARRVVEQLTDRQTVVLELFAKGHTPVEVANRLNLALATVDSHKTVIFSCCRTEWGFSSAARLNYYFLRQKFEVLFLNQ